MKTIVVCICVFILYSGISLGTTLTVPTPYLTIQDAIDAAVVGTGSDRTVSHGASSLGLRVLFQIHLRNFEFNL